jgi:glycosyltransferase involved in cell wall biosynthesis
MKKQKFVVIMPAYNAERTLAGVYKEVVNVRKSLPKDVSLSIILTDDGSKDKTVALSRKLGIRTFVHKKNRGYGGNQKTCFRNALKMGADFVIMLHPDGQYDPKDLPKFINVLKTGKADLVLGSRFMGERDETPFYKSFSIRVITFIYNFVLGTSISEVNTGYRGYSRRALETIPFMKNGEEYIFDPQAIIQVVYAGLTIKDVPVAKKYNKEAISPNFSKSVEHGIENMKLLGQYVLHRLGIQKVDFLTK